MFLVYDSVDCVCADQFFELVIVTEKWISLLSPSIWVTALVKHFPNGYKLSCFTKGSWIKYIFLYEFMQYSDFVLIVTATTGSCKPKSSTSTLIIEEKCLPDPFHFDKYSLELNLHDKQETEDSICVTLAPTLHTSSDTRYLRSLWKLGCLIPPVALSWRKIK